MSPVYEQERGKTSPWVYVGGICGGCIVLYIVLAAVGFFFARSAMTGRGPAGRAMSAATTQACTNNLLQVGSAMQMYAADNKGYLPPADRWVDALETKGTNAGIFTCMDVKTGTGAPPVMHYYAMNSKYGGKKLEDVRKLGNVPLVYDSTATTTNASDPETSMPSPGRHGGKNNILYASGAVTQK